MPSKWVRFAIGLAIGVLLGLGYAWRIQPVAYYDTAPDSLRQDYRADYILMTAQAYRADGDLRLALLRLAALGPQPPAGIVSQAIAFARANAFAADDLEALQRLADDLAALPAGAEIDGS
ncbi:MAG TPA: hypothetical protein VK449_08165 [Anaerolineales bacterium]|nr:hypothetical protein [Anaerolineales bacterium]